LTRQDSSTRILTAAAIAGELTQFESGENERLPAPTTGGLFKC
ncbi:MAG: hypothetical protein JWN92_880, partial [Candidatus Acidoferrum typicum]|nr:hypothetical protein [Candidatus Acidoferrum typicum]